MTTSGLRQILDLLKGRETPISLGYIAHQLNISPERAESMLEFWIQKGKIAVSEEEADCETCGVNGSCPFVYQLPTSYQIKE
jgi:hypothetical protein